MNIEDPGGVLGTSPEDPQTETRAERMGRLAAEMMALGVDRRQAERLLAQHPLDEIERQVRWIEYRSARKKASLLVTAIDRNYEAPANLPPDAW